MFGWIKRRLEQRALADVGSVYAAYFAGGGASYSWQVSPAVLSGSLAFADNAGSLTEFSRRLYRQSSILRAYQRCIVGGVLTGEPEAPAFAEDAVPDAIAAAVAALWTEQHPVEMERDLLRRLIVDGDCLILPDGEVIPTDGFEAVTDGPEWNRRVIGWKIGRGSRVHRKVLYLGDRDPGAARAQPWQAGALPAASSLVNARVGGGHAIGTAARWTTMLTADATRQTAALDAGVRRGVQGDGDDAGEDQRQDLKTTGVGSIVFLRPGEGTSRPAAGPDSTAQAYESILEAEAAGALNLPLSELKSDYSSGSFSNLKMAWVDAGREYARRRIWFHRAYRRVMYLDALAEWFAAGRLPGGVSPAVMAALKSPAWAGPYREPPQPEKELVAIAALAKSLPVEAKELLEGGE